MASSIKKEHKLLPPRYEFVSVLEHGNLLIQQEKMFGLANAEGKILINPKYHTLEDLNNNYVIVERDGKVWRGHCSRDQYHTTNLRSHLL